MRTVNVETGETPAESRVVHVEMTVGETIATFKTVEVSRAALMARLNRRLKGQGQTIEAARSVGAKADLGPFYITSAEGIARANVDPVALARELGVLRSWEAAPADLLPSAPIGVVIPKPRKGAPPKRHAIHYKARRTNIPAEMSRAVELARTTADFMAKMDLRIADKDQRAAWVAELGKIREILRVVVKGMKG